VELNTDEFGVPGYGRRKETRNQPCSLRDGPGRGKVMNLNTLSTLLSKGSRILSASAGGRNKHNRETSGAGLGGDEQRMSA
jgi:hypothetical protein